MSDLLNSASLVLIPSGYKEDTVYSVVPSDGSGDLSFTRASNGTRVNSAGLVEVCPWNLVEYSEDFAQAGPIWNKYQATITSNATTAPNGTLTADSITDNTTNDVHIAYQDRAGIVAGAYTISIYAKASTLSHINLQWYSGSAFYTSNAFNLSNGTTTGANQSIESIGNGWYRCIFTFTTTVSGLQYPYVMTNNGTSNAYVGTGQSVFIWGYQLNIGSTAKPYFPTTDRLNVPRLTYQNGGGGCPSLLLEKQSTNLITYSEQFDNVAWVKDDLSVIANATTSPDGTQNSDKIVENTTNTIHRIREGGRLSSGTQTASCYFKASERSVVFMGITDLTTGEAAATFNLSNGTGTNSSSGSWTNTSFTISNMGNGWYRCTVTGTQGAGLGSRLDIYISNGSTISYAGTAGYGLFIYGAQLEASSYPTSYIPTTSASATRVADACFKTGISSLIGQSEGVLFADFVYLGETQSEVIDISDGTENNRVMCYITFGGVFQIYVTVGGTTDGLISTSFSPVAGTRYKIAIGYKLNDIIFYLNGTSLGTDTSATIPATSKLTISNGGASNYLLASQFNQAILFKTRLTNAELASLTTL